MTSAELKWIESELAVILPTTYKQFQRRYPVKLFRFRKLDGAGDDEEQYWLFSRADKVVSFTRSFREHHQVYARGGKMKPWPEHYLVIGSEGYSGGDCFCLDTSTATGGVYRFYHERATFKKKAGSIREYAAKLLSRLTLEAEEAEMEVEEDWDGE